MVDNREQKLNQTAFNQAFIRLLELHIRLDSGTSEGTNISKPRQIDINEVHRNEQVNVVALCSGAQIIICDNEMNNPNDYYLLVPMKGREVPGGIEYKRNQFGELYESFVRKHWGDALERFPCRWVAKVARRPSLMRNIQSFWEEMERNGNFIFWDIEGGPVEWFTRNDPNCLGKLHVPILRVYEITEDLRNCVAYKGKEEFFAPYLTEHHIEAYAKPVIGDKEFERKCDEILEIIFKQKYQITTSSH